MMQRVSGATRSAVVALVAAVALVAIPAPVPAGPPMIPDQVVPLRNIFDPVLMAVELSRMTGGTATRVHLARADVFADSMASGGLQVDGPLLLVSPGGQVHDAVLAEIERLGAQEVVLLGGPAAIPEATADLLRARGLAVRRLFGPSRIETAAAIARDLVVESAEPPSHAVVVRAFGAPRSTDETQAVADSLSATALAAMLGVPVLLSETEQLSTATEAFLAAAGIPDVILVGGEAALGAAVEQGIRDLGIRTRRVQGPTRDDTAVAVAALITELVGPLRGVTLVDGTSPQAWVPAFASAYGAAMDVRAVLLARGAVPANTTLTFLEDADLPDADGAIVSAIDREGTDLAAAAAGFGTPPTFLVQPADGALVVDGQQVVITTAAEVSGIGGSCVDPPIPTVDNETVIRVARPAGASDCRLTFLLEQDGVASFEEVLYAFVDEAGLVSDDPDLGLVGGYQADIAADGSTIAFLGEMADGSVGIFRRVSSKVPGLGTYTSRVDRRADGTPALPGSAVLDGPRVSADGRFIVFESEDPSLDTDAPPDGTRGPARTYVLDVATSTMRTVSIGFRGTPTIDSTWGDVTDDGTLATYVGQDNDPDSPGVDTYLFFHDLETGQVEGRLRGTRLQSGVDLAGDGSLAIVRTPDALVDDDTNEHADVYAIAPFTPTVERVSVATGGAEVTNTLNDGSVSAESIMARISDDGEHVVWVSGGEAAGQPGEGGYPPGFDVFAHDLFSRTTQLISSANAQMQQLETASLPDISSDGALVAFASVDHPESAAAQFPFASCGIYISERAGPLRLVVDPRTSTDHAAPCESSQIRVSDGGAVVFDTFEGLAAGDDGRDIDVYLGGGDLVSEGR